MDVRALVRQFSWVLAASALWAVLVFPLVAWPQEVTTEETPESVAVAEAPVAPVGPEIAPLGIVFVEIRLSDERAVATDSSGREWVYDFGGDVWVEGTPGQEGGTPTDRVQPVDAVPIDLRAIRPVEVKPFERSVTIGYDEYVDGDIIATGRVTIKGWVKGDVRSIDKRVLVAETGQVDGDVEAPSVVVQPGGVVGGKVRETGGPLDVESLTQAISTDAIVVVTALAFVLLFFGFLVLAVAPRHVNRMNECIMRHWVRSYALGLLFTVLMPVVAALFIITLVGILVVPFVPLVYLVAAAMGFVSFGGLLGGWFLRRIIGSRVGLQVRTALGTLLHALLWLVVILLLGAGNSFLLGLGYAVLVAAILTTSFAVFTGIGGAILTRFGSRDYVSWKDRQPTQTVPPAPAPPPLHEPPPVVAPWPLSPEGPHQRGRPEDTAGQHS